MEEILYNKHKEIDECKKFIEFIEKYFLNSNKPDSNSNILINLLNQKLKILNSLDYKNCKNLVLSFEKLDDEIYNQIEILKSEIKGDIKNFTYYKQIKYNVDNINKNLKKDKNLSITKIIEEFLVKNEYFEKYIYKKSVKVKREAFFDIFNFIKNHQWISTLLFFAFGFISFLFVFYIKSNFIPILNQNEFTFILLISSSAILITSFICLAYIYIFWLMYDIDKRSKKFDKKIFYYDSLFVWIISLVSTLLFFIFFGNYIDKIDIAWLNKFLSVNKIALFLIFLTIFIFAVIVSFFIKFKIFAFIMIIAFLILFYIFLNFSILLIFTSLFLTWILLNDNITNKKEFINLYALLYIFLIFGTLGIISDYIFKTLNISGVEYKYIVLDKKADEFLPDDMIYKFNCDKEVEIISYIDSNLTYKTDNGSESRNLEDKDCLTFIDDNNKTINTDNKKFTFKDGNLTFTEKKNNTIQNVKANFNYKSCLTYAKYKNDSIVLYNIEAISTLGKYWYIKTKFDDKFELQSDFIKTKVKK
ncbi:hypothetical protein [Campylobacter ureolyticus]|uniref:hypothetical protein n=1 Tax=Campylobacter ureolyticus TaxID=827 RepID=UPI0022B59453|nr:hypothetical protein [Campylobacter ureolyticus]MCZ6168361.1 hypothetical protein [Campylobacter ureolyticus]